MAQWSASYINDLPDSAFLYIEPGGAKDDTGKTTPRSLRHFPVRDASGNVDPDHCRNALSRIPQSDLPQAVKDKARNEAEQLLASLNSSSKSAALKFVGPDTIEGPVFREGQDFHGERFVITPGGSDQPTDFCLDWFGKSGRPALYEHGLDGAMKTALVGRQTDYEERDSEIWAQTQLDANARYRKRIDQLIEAGALSYSAGAMPHLATKNPRTGAIKRFPWVELSLTPTPANPDNLPVFYAKSADFLAHLEEAGLVMPSAAVKALAEWSDTVDAQPEDGLTFAARADRLAVDLREFTDQLTEVAAVRGKSGRVLSAATRDRLAQHPAAIRQVADDLDELLTTADAGKSATADRLADVIAQSQLDERFRDLQLRGLNL